MHAWIRTGMPYPCIAEGTGGEDLPYVGSARLCKSAGILSQMCFGRNLDCSSSQGREAAAKFHSKYKPTPRGSQQPPRPPRQTAGAAVRAPDPRGRTARRRHTVAGCVVRFKQRGRGGPSRPVQARPACTCSWWCKRQTCKLQEFSSTRLMGSSGTTPCNQPSFQSVLQTVEAPDQINHDCDNCCNNWCRKSQLCSTIGPDENAGILRDIEGSRWLKLQVPCRTSWVPRPGFPGG